MVRSELALQVTTACADRHGMSPKQIALAVDNLLETMMQSLLSGGRIELRGFGTFCLRFRDSRRAHNPRSGETIITDPTFGIHFKAGKKLRESVNNNAHNPITGLREIKEEREEEVEVA